MRFCKKCLLPDTKPDLIFYDNVCAACINYEKRKQIDWNKRKQELIEILAKYRSKDNSNWDCIIPISGGKDSTYQVIRIKELGLNPLCVVVTTCHLTPIGRKNIDNIKSLNVDVLEFTNKRDIRKKLNAYCLKEIGDISWPEHVSIFTIPIRVSVNYNIPLIIWGECSQNEYGGPAASSDNNILNRRWLEEFGGLIGLRVEDILELTDIARKDAISYVYPNDVDIQRVGVTGIFLGYYMPWSGLTNSIISQCHGFSTSELIVEGSPSNYENLDNYQTGIHDYFKYLKFGFDRNIDIVSTLIRRGILTRDDSIMCIKHLEGKFPWKRLGKPIDEILNNIGVTVEEFSELCDEHTNKDIFKTDENGNLIKRADNSPIRLYNP